MEQLSIEHLRYIVRVLTYQQNPKSAPDDIHAGVNWVSQFYSQYRLQMDFSSAAVEARARMLEVFLKNPSLPRATIGTVLDLQWMLSNINPRSGLVVSTLGSTTEYGLYKINEMQVTPDGGIAINLSKDKIQPDFPFIDKFPQDRPKDQPAPKDDHKITVGYVLNRTLNLIVVEPHASAIVFTLDGESRRIASVTQVNDNVAVIHLEQL